MSKFYILVNHKPVLVSNLHIWAEKFKLDERQVRRTLIGDVEISTVFLGIDHRRTRRGPPILFETMIFDATGKYDYYEDRCSTWKEATQMHQRACDVVCDTRWKSGMKRVLSSLAFPSQKIKEWNSNWQDRFF